MLLERHYVIPHKLSGKIDYIFSPYTGHKITYQLLGNRNPFTFNRHQFKLFNFYGATTLYLLKKGW